MQRLPIFSVALLSATALAYEVLLTRLFSIIQWHHYAFMIISLALLGYGASGTFLALARKTLLAWFPASYIANLVLFGISTLVCFLIAQSITFNPEEILYDVSQWWNLAVIYLVLSLPFFFAANAIGLSLTKFRTRLAGVYAADLIGAGVGSLSIVVLLFVVFPMQALQTLSALGLVAALIAAWEHRVPSRLVWTLLICAAITPLILPANWIKLELSPYKDLSQTLRITGSRVIGQMSSPLGLIDVVENNVIPLRHAPGLSLNAKAGPPAQLGLFIDGSGPSAINRSTDATDSLEYLAQTTSALPYYLKKPDDVLVLGAGGGTMVLQALEFGAAEIDAVELNPQVVQLVRDIHREYSGEIYQNERISLFTAELRGFLAATGRQYDLIQLPVLDSHSASATGLHALGEDYLYTVEAFGEYLHHLAPGGLLAVTRWVRIPPRDTLKVFATVVQALEHRGVEMVGQRLALIRGWQTSTLLVKNGPFTTEELAGTRRFCGSNSFDVAWLPDMSPDEANRFNMLSRPWIYQGAEALLGDAREQFLSDYKFNLIPSTDNQPFFFNFFRWRTLPEIAERYGEGGVPLLDTGYLVLVATLVQAILASTVLILLPLAFGRDLSPHADTAIHRNRILVYFAALGAGFLFIEIAFIQKLTLFLHHPLYAIAVSLTAFLIFAGLGSTYAHRKMKTGSDEVPQPGIGVPVTALVFLCGLYITLSPVLFDHLMQLPDPVRIVVSIFLVAPLAFCMGMPFPRGLWQLGRHTPALLPWAWGINGCASVVSTVLATLLAIHHGFNAVVITAVVFYVIAAFSFPRPAHASG